MPTAGLILLIVGAAVVAATDDKTYRMCVPQIYYEDCLNLLKDPSEAGIRMSCVAGRDRIACLDMIEQRQADVLATEPEDMYVAYHTKNADYRVISEIRTKEDANAEFRYEGIILVKKNSNIHSLKDLHGTKSCHTGFGRNVGYKIPVTKLKNLHVLKVSADPEISATERELKSLSEFFSESCLVGAYSAHPDADRLLKKKYANLCALCEKPEQCNYPDKYSGYDGAIRCLDKGKGDVAFTKVQYIKKYFGLTAGNVAEGDASDFEYLCEDGTRRPVTGAACSWAQRPWTGYISNANNVDNVEELHELQNRLEHFFENGLHAQNKAAAAHLLINENAVYHSKAQAVEPKEYLERAGYKDVIERDGSAIRSMRLCVKTAVEMAKCETLVRAAYARDIRPELQCVQADDCVEAVHNKRADLAVVPARNYDDARGDGLSPIAYERLADDDVYVAVITPSLSKDAAQKAPIHYEPDNERARIAAAFLNKRRGLDWCSAAPSSETELLLTHASALEAHKDKQLLCPNMERKPVTEFRSCNFEYNLPTAVFIRDSTSAVERETIKQMLISLSTKFGPTGKLADVFALFAAYAKDASNVLFDDKAIDFVTELKNNNFNEQIYNELKCDSNQIKKDN